MVTLEIIAETPASVLIVEDLFSGAFEPLSISLHSSLIEATPLDHAQHYWDWYLSRCVGHPSICPTLSVE